jgi:hypothetical protein
MNRLVELLKRKDMMREVILEGDTKMKGAEDGNNVWKLRESEIIPPSFEEDEVPQALFVSALAETPILLPLDQY